jgi:AraC-like DNA-binding protein
MSGSRFDPPVAAVETARALLLRNSVSPFASLAVLASHRSGDGKAYCHAELSKRFGKGVAHRALVRLHAQVLREWLNMPLDEQKFAVQEYLRGFGDGLPNRPSITSFARFVPESAASPERQLFEAELSVTLMLVLAIQDSHDGTTASPSVWRTAATLRTVKSSALNGKLALRGIGTMLKVSPNHLGRIFRHHVGSTFHGYLLAKRMFAAAELLRSQEVRLRDVSRALGYRDESNFCRDFCKAFQKGPTAYRIQSLEERADAMPAVFFKPRVQF